jgi:hypothetical protein
MMVFLLPQVYFFLQLFFYHPSDSVVYNKHQSCTVTLVLFDGGTVFHSYIVFMK